MRFSTPYTNVKLPRDVAWLETDEDISKVLAVLVGEGCRPLGEPLHYDASIGRSDNGSWVEGDIGFTMGDGAYALAYDFMVADGMARVFRYDVTQTGGIGKDSGWQSDRDGVRLAGDGEPCEGDWRVGMYVLMNLYAGEYERPEMRKVGVYGTKQEAREALRRWYDEAREDGRYDEDYTFVGDDAAWVDGELSTNHCEIFEVRTQ